MTSQGDPSQDNATCLKLMSLGYARSKRVRLYGQELELVSDPFSKEGTIMIEALRGNESVSRTVRLPLSVVQVASHKKRIA
jgi:hypothetical protein